MIEVINQGNLQLKVHTATISDSSEIARFEAESEVHPIPDMFYGRAEVRISIGQVSVSMNPIEAISCCRYSPGSAGFLKWGSVTAVSLIDPTVRSSHLSELKVKHSETWSVSRSNPSVRDLEYDHDWTYTSPYWGAIEGYIKDETVVGEACPDRFLPHQLLLDTSIPILKYIEVDFWDDELDDCGFSRMGVKIRVMSSFIFVLLKFELRVDGVISSRCLETRFFYRFGDQVLKREFKFVENGKEVKSLRVNQTVHLS